MATFKVIGQPTARVEGPEKVTGAAKYGIDALLPGTLWCKVLRSPHPRARILNVDASKALALPGVHAVVTGADVRGLRTGNMYRDEPLLAWDVANFAGEKVAAVCAEDDDTAERALALIDVTYEPLTPLLSAQEAVKPDAPLLHPDFNSYHGVVPIDKPSNIYGHMTREQGNVKEGFAAADLVLERTYQTQWAHQGYLEPHACLVWIDPEGVAQVWAASQMPSGNRDEVARVLGLPPESIVFNFSHVGGSFGGKTDATGVALCYLMAKATGRPVKFIMDYTDELAAMNPRHPSTIHVKAGVTNDGLITAWQATAYFATGAYAAYAPTPPAGGLSVFDVAGPYRMPNIRIDSYQVYTNTVPCGYSRGPGTFQGSFAGESHIDELAKALGMDPLELRLKNVIRTADQLMPHRLWSPVVAPDAPDYQEIRLEETLRTAAETAGYRDDRPAGVGRGIAIAHHSQLGGDAHVAAHLNPDGHVLVNLSTFSPGMDTYTIAAQVVAEELGISTDRISVMPWSTAQGPSELGVAGDRGARTTTLAAHTASQDLKQALQRMAAELYGWTEESVTVQDGEVGYPGRNPVPMEELARRTGEPITGTGDAAESFRGSPYTSFAAHVAEVSVDQDTGHVRLLKYTIAQETGQVLNPVGFHGQLNGGLVHAIGQALMEELPMDGGRITVGSLADYKLPTSMDLPELRTVVLDSSAGHGPYNVRGVGNASIALPAPAIANAIADACGARVRELPITAEKVHRSITSTSR